MTLCIFGTDENNDLYLGENGQLVVLEDLDAVTQACEQAVKAQRGELIFQEGRGVPTLQTLWQGNPDVPQFEYYAVEAIQSVPTVVRVVSFDGEVSGDTFTYEAQIETEFGSVFLDGGI